MADRTDIRKPVYSLLPWDLVGVDSLAELALDMRWSWNHEADEVWWQLDPALWDLTHNSWVVLQTVSRDQFQKVMSDPIFRKKIDNLLQSQKHANTSELDGWWAEAYSPDVGWAIGDGKEHGENPEYDRMEANALYDLVEQKVIPEFYNRNKKGIPGTWVERIRKSMSQLTPRYSANRSVREYTDINYND